MCLRWSALNVTCLDVDTAVYKLAGNTLVKICDCDLIPRLRGIRSVISGMNHRGSPCWMAKNKKFITWCLGVWKRGLKAVKIQKFASIRLWGPYAVYVYLTLLELFSSVRSYSVAPLTLQKAKLSALADQTWHCYNLIILVDGWRHHNLLGSGQNLYLGNGQSASWQTALSFLRQCVCVCVWGSETDHCMGESWAG